MEKVSCRKCKKTKVDVTGELLDKMIASNKMLTDLELKRAKLEEKQTEMDM